MRNEKRWRATAVQDAGALFVDSRNARSVLECASPSAYAARHSAASARRRLALWAQRGENGRRLERLSADFECRWLCASTNENLFTERQPSCYIERDMGEKPQKIITVDQLPDNPLEMPPPHWRGGGAIFHLEQSLWNIEELLKAFLPIHADTDALLEKHFDKYPDDETSESEKAMEEFSEITDELSEIEFRIRLSGEIACLMSAIESEDDINRFCVFNLHKDISESIERLAPSEKLLAAAASVGKSGTKQTSAFEGLCQLVSWRNAFAHGHCVDRPTKHFGTTTLSNLLTIQACQVFWLKRSDLLGHSSACQITSTKSA